MQIISLLHVIFDVLAFKNDIGISSEHSPSHIPPSPFPPSPFPYTPAAGFWKGRETMSGLSSRAVLSSAAQTLIIYLYLLDSDHVNQLVIATYTVSTFLEMWKVVKVLAIMSAANARRKATTQKKAPKRPPTLADSL